MNKVQGKFLVTYKYAVLPVPFPQEVLTFDKRHTQNASIPVRVAQDARSRHDECGDCCLGCYAGYDRGAQAQAGGRLLHDTLFGPGSENLKHAIYIEVYGTHLRMMASSLRCCDMLKLAALLLMPVETLN